jgi:hypothetical protein
MDGATSNKGSSADTSPPNTQGGDDKRQAGRDKEEKQLKALARTKINVTYVRQYLATERRQVRATTRERQNVHEKETRRKGKGNNNRDRQRREIEAARDMCVTHHRNTKRVCCHEHTRNQLQKKKSSQGHISKHGRREETMIQGHKDQRGKRGKEHEQ